MEIQRTAYNDLLTWKTTKNKKALLVTGARQVGKTYLIRQFATKEYKNFVEINFIESPSAATIFEGTLDANEIIANLSAFTNKPLEPGNTLIFFDEIQECPRARTAMKFLIEDGRFDYIESGSLLGVQYKEVPSYPVGYEAHLRMYPLTLEEFLNAISISADALEHVKEAYKKISPVPSAIHEKLLRSFMLYMVVGGLPDAVSEFIDSNDLSRVHQIQSSILELYKQDITKYAASKPHVKKIFESIASELDKKNKRFKLSDLSKTARMERYESDFMWLVDAGVALPNYNVSAPTLPLSINAQHNLFKLFLCDVGLLSAQMSADARYKLLQGDTSINWGSALENAISQELAAHGFPLHYFTKPKYGEVDFLIEKAGEVLPIEAKSGNDYKSHKALENVMSVRDWHIKNAIVLCKDNISQVDGITYLPWYCSMFIKQDQAPGVIDIEQFLI